MCTVAAIVAFLGFMPPKGTEIVIPRSQVRSYSQAQQSRARRCAARHGIAWRIDETR